MATFDPSGGVPLTSAGSGFEVVRYDRDAAGDDRFEPLPNVVCLSYRYREGPHPATAQFAYILDDTDPDSPFPTTWEEVWPAPASADYAVAQDDELLVYEVTEDGSRLLVFDGFASLPQADVGRGQSVSFLATSVHVRLWDTPVRGAVYRDGDDPQAGDRVETDLPVRFNPDGKPNCTPDGYDLDDGTDAATPLFLDALLKQVPSATPVTPAFWTLGGFARYLAQSMNADEEWVKNPTPPTGETIDDYLKAAKPVDGDFMDLSDSATYTKENIVIRDTDATGRAWPVALDEQLGYHGYRIFLDTRDDPDDPGAPLNELIVYRVDGRDGNAPVELYYPPPGSSLADGLPDFEVLGLVSDQHDAANEIVIESKELGREGGFVLAPGFVVAAGDAATIDSFRSSALTASGTTDATRKKYRYYTFDELGLGHWDFSGTPSFVTGTCTSLDAVLGAPVADGAGAMVRQYAHRPRPGEGTLFSLDDKGHPKRAELEVSRDYAGASPGVWDGTGTWRSLADSGWKLDRDGLGIWITADSPESWALPKSTGTVVPGDVLHGVTSLAAPAGADTKFTLKLTCVIRGDMDLGTTAARRDASPMRFTVQRLIDSKDHWQKQIVCASSKFNSSGQDVTIRDDTDKAQAHADALRLAREFPVTAGSVVVPWVTHALGVGDFLSRITGREVDLVTSAGGAGGEGPRYPVVTGFSVGCQIPQHTRFEVSDARAEPERANHGFGRSRRA